MTRFRPVSDYRVIVHNMPTTELVGLAKTYNACQTLCDKETRIKGIINGELKRRTSNPEDLNIMLTTG